MDRLDWSCSRSDGYKFPYTINVSLPSSSSPNGHIYLFLLTHTYAIYIIYSLAILSYRAYILKLKLKLKPTQILLLEMALLAHSDLHVWDNAAFDVSGASCSASPALLPNPHSADENLSPNFSNSPLSPSVPVAGKKQPPPPFSTPKQDKPLKLLFKQGLLRPARRPDTDGDESIVDSEIESILKEIARLSERLEALRSRKKDAHREADPVIGVEGQSDPHGVQVVATAATTTAPLKQSTKTTKTVRVSAQPEIAKPKARGVSMCPSEIHGGTRLMLQQENSQSRRKSCFWKHPPPLEEEDANVGKDRAHRLSLADGAKNGSRTLSPKSRQSKLMDLRRGIVTVGSKSNKLAENKEEAATGRFQPKKLFRDANPPSVPKSLKNARVVPSRYNQIPTTTTTTGRAAAARNSPEKEPRQKKEMRGKSQGRPILMGAGDACGRRKRRGASEDERSSVSSCTTESLALEEVAVALPKIKAVRLVGESPRDSGCAKRAADLVGRRTYFSCETAAEEDDGVAPICQVLDYDDDDDDACP